MDPSLFDYHLPPERIAQYPAEQRDASRLLVGDRAGGRWEDRVFGELPDLLRGGDLLVVNDSRVIPARLLGHLEREGAQVELLFLRAIGPSRWEALARPGKRCRPGAVVRFGDGEAGARVVAPAAPGRRIVETQGGGSVRELLERYGVPPLPPYIARHQKPGQEDWERYQTVYAAHEGSVAAPTAGLHFTQALLHRLRIRGVEVRTLTLHVGAGTFRPIRSARVEAHRMEAEQVLISAEVADAVNQAKAEGRRVIAVGTTTCRALEAAADERGTVRPMSGPTDLFIYPGYRFKVIDALLTNFHLPRSSLLLLVCAFAGREFILGAYGRAVDAGYRFYSYGDAMLIV
ncbi:MAG: tRNA preQ1(34) S-adenosylmethionine ribosyltransferase-isomerase QueA [Candidatus Rokubacteria bacterium]|nr:tRNA preQ1(34) S-adenosylmethionine ribosyltransferase-isomerase QueA [Candidatus Rokubacteria bacterium]